MTHPLHFFLAFSFACTFGIGQVFAQVDCLGVNGGTALPGTACDDGLPATVFDEWSNQCVCTGICISDTSPWGPPGSMCEDGNPNTTGDVWDEECGCHGISLFDCEGTPFGAALPGTPCDDGDLNTINDTWSLTCACIGELSTTVAMHGSDLTRSWPSPAHDMLNITTSAIKGNVRITILDQRGGVALMLNRRIVGGTMAIPVQDLETGLYTLRIDAPGASVAHRFVVSH